MNNDYKEYIQQHYKPGTTNIDSSLCYQQKIGPTGVVAFKQVIKWPIQSINFNIYFIENQGMQTLIHAGSQWPTLQELMIQKNNISCDGLKDIDKAGWVNLKKILLNKNFIKAKGFQYLLKANWPLLEKIQLSHCQIGLEGAMKFREINWPQLKVLNLNYNLIGCQGVRQLSKCKLPNLQILELSNNKIYAKGAYHLTTMQLKNLKYLTLNRNLIGRDNLNLSDLGCMYLCNLKVQGLKCLRLFGNDLSVNGIRQIIYSGILMENCFLEIIKNHFTFADIEQDIKICKVFSNQF